MTRREFVPARRPHRTRLTWRERWFPPSYRAVPWPIPEDWWCRRQARRALALGGYRLGWRTYLLRVGDVILDWILAGLASAIVVGAVSLLARALAS